MANNAFAKGACPYCAGHLEFPVEATGQTIACPHCGQLIQLAVLAPAAPPRRGSRGVLPGMILGMVLVIAAVGAWLFWRPPAHSVAVLKAQPILAALPHPTAVSTDAPTAASEPRTLALTNDFAILPFKLEKTPGSSLVYVTGTVRNLSGGQRFGVKIAFGLFDTNDNSIGAASDYQAELDPHAEWRFKALVMASQTTSARFQSIAEDK